jgi:hypothetical protein
LGVVDAFFRHTTISLSAFKTLMVAVFSVSSAPVLGRRSPERLATSLQGIEARLNAHALKEEWLGDKAILQHFDIYRHNKTGESIIFQKKGKGVPIQTGEFIN